jgi:two-component system, cell cycle sensor histidine kinase and response regulator CckA
MVKLLNKRFKDTGIGAAAVRITIVYAIIGVLWIAFSDKLLITVFDSHSVSDYALLQTYKGWFFILLTSVILFLLIYGNLKSLQRSEELRDQTERRSRTIFENSGTAMAILEDDLSISLVNEKFVDLTGYERTEIEGNRTFTDLLSSEDMIKLVDYRHERMYGTITFPASYEFRLLNKQNQTKYVLVGTARIPGTQQSIVSLIDISDRKELEAKYLRAQRMESIGTLSGGIAHDLNNILAPILLSIESLRDIADDDKARRLLHIMKSSVQRGSDLVNQIVSFSRGIYGEQITIQPHYILNEITRIVHATFTKSIQLETDIPTDLGNISGNPTQVYQALLNICVNARDAMPDGGTLSIRAENISIGPNNEHSYLKIRHGSYIAISISDTGTGIPHEIRDKLFSPFFTTKEEGKGTGLGLPTVEFILRNHGGYIEVDSEENRGSTFTLFFPVSDEPAVEPKKEAEDLPTGNGACVLIIDDEAAVREMISEILHSHNYEVLVAKDGAEGLAKYLHFKDRIDVVLTDNNMPNFNNEHLITSLREANPDVKVVLTTGSHEAQRDFQDLRPPIAGFLHKPYTTHSLLTLLHKTLNP